MRDKVVQDRTRLQERYLQDDLPTRLGGLANESGTHPIVSPFGQSAVECLLEESKFFIEWTAGEVDIAAELVMQIQLARWQRNWQSLWADAVQRIQMADQAQVWSERAEISGILSRGCLRKPLSPLLLVLICCPQFVLLLCPSHL